jgi:hypothetical protein
MLDFSSQLQHSMAAIDWKNRSADGPSVFFAEANSIFKIKTRSGAPRYGFYSAPRFDPILYAQIDP